VSDFKCPQTQRKKETTTELTKMVSLSRPKPEVL